MKLPSSKVKKRSKSPSPLHQNFKIIESKTKYIKEDKLRHGTNERQEYSKEFLERQILLKQQYQSSQNTTVNPLEKQKSSKNDELGPDVFKLG